jgi:hypothetical protein
MSRGGFRLGWDGLQGRLFARGVSAVVSKTFPTSQRQQYDGGKRYLQIQTMLAENFQGSGVSTARMMCSVSLELPVTG